MTHRIIPGSQRRAVGHVIGEADKESLADVTLVLRRDKKLDIKEGFQADNGASKEDIDKVTSALKSAGIKILNTHAASRRIRIEGTIDQLENFFGVNIKKTKHSDGGVQSRLVSGPTSVPEELGDIVTAVLGLDNRRQARHYSLAIHGHALPENGFKPDELASIYEFPDGDGAGQTIAIIELGGGYSDKDLDHYFSTVGVTKPKIKSVGIDGGSNDYGTDYGADGEVELDIEVAGGIAPKANYVVYFAPNTDAGFVDAIAEAAHADPTPVAISISWGGSEDSWTDDALNSLNDALADAVALGATVATAAGDQGSSDSDDSGNRVHVDFPASSPYALACGGTKLEARNGQRVSETVWNNDSHTSATGGGISQIFDVPDYQKEVNTFTRATKDADSDVDYSAVKDSATSHKVTHEAVSEKKHGKKNHHPKSHARHGRGVPDVSAVADPQTGYYTYIHGQASVFGGTSAVSPLWSGLIARLAQSSGRKYGLIHTELYAGVKAGEPAPLLLDITEGNNGSYEAGVGWDPTTGLGVPHAQIKKLAEPTDTKAKKA